MRRQTSHPKYPFFLFYLHKADLNHNSLFLSLARKRECCDLQQKLESVDGNWGKHPHKVWTEELS